MGSGDMPSLKINVFCKISTTNFIRKMISLRIFDTKNTWSNYLVSNLSL